MIFMKAQIIIGFDNTNSSFDNLIEYSPFYPDYPYPEPVVIRW